jgi:uncharacterized membrane protein YebE (DUF533 family)
MGFLGGISDKIAAMRQRSKDKKEFFASLIAAAEDGKLTDAEIREIQAQYKELGLSQDDMKGVRVKAYNAPLLAACYR